MSKRHPHFADLRPETLDDSLTPREILAGLSFLLACAAVTACVAFSTYSLLRYLFT